MARPRGEVRQALADAAQRLCAVRGHVSAREIAEAAQVGYAVARVSIDNLERAGELLVVGRGHEPGQRWHKLYEPAGAGDADDVPQAWGGIEALTAVMHAVARPVD